MQFLRRILVGACASLLMMVMLGLGFVWSLNQVLATPAKLKSALRESGVYSNVVSSALDAAQKDQQEQGTSNDEIPVNQPEIRKIIENAFPPSYIQTQGEYILDATYAWLEGKTPALSFSVDVSEAKTRLANGVGSYVQQRLTSLPVCDAQTLQYPPSDIDAFNTTCVPAGFDIAGAAEKARSEIQNGEFLKDAKLDSNTIKTDDGKTLTDQLEPTKKAYACIKGCATAAIVSVAVLSAGIVLLSPSRRAGFRKLSILWIVGGAINIFFGWLSGFLMNKAAQEVAKSPGNTQALQEKLINLMQNLTNDLRMAWIVIGASLVVLGIGILLVLRFTKQNPTVEDMAGNPDIVPTPKPSITSDTTRKKSASTPNSSKNHT